MTRIVVGYDGSNQCHDALTLGATIAGSTGAQVVLAMAFPHVLPSVDRERYATSLAHESDPLVADALSRLPESVVQVGRRASGGVPAARGLRDVASNVDAALLVVGSAHRGAVGRVLAGSVGEALLGDAPCPVAIAPRGYAEGECQPPRIVGAAFDATHESRRAVSFAAQLARSASAALRVFGVVEAVQLGDVVYRSAVGGPDPRFSRDALEDAGRAGGWRSNHPHPADARGRLESASIETPDATAVAAPARTGNPGFCARCRAGLARRAAFDNGDIGRDRSSRRRRRSSSRSGDSECLALSAPCHVRESTVSTAPSHPRLTPASVETAQLVAENSGVVGACDCFRSWPQPSSGGCPDVRPGHSWDASRKTPTKERVGWKASRYIRSHRETGS